MVDLQVLLNNNLGLFSERAAQIIKDIKQERYAGLKSFVKQTFFGSTRGGVTFLVTLTDEGKDYLDNAIYVGKIIENTRAIKTEQLVAQISKEFARQDKMVKEGKVANFDGMDKQLAKLFKDSKAKAALQKYKKVPARFLKTIWAFHADCPAVFSWCDCTSYESDDAAIAGFKAEIEALGVNVLFAFLDEATCSAQVMLAFERQGIEMAAVLNSSIAIAQQIHLTELPLLSNEVKSFHMDAYTHVLRGSLEPYNRSDKTLIEREGLEALSQQSTYCKPIVPGSNKNFRVHNMFLAMATSKFNVDLVQNTATYFNVLPDNVSKKLPDYFTPDQRNLIDKCLLKQGNTYLYTKAGLDKAYLETKATNPIAIIPDMNDALFLLYSFTHLVKIAAKLRFVHRQLNSCTTLLDYSSVEVDTPLSGTEKAKLTQKTTLGPFTVDVGETLDKAQLKQLLKLFPETYNFLCASIYDFSVGDGPVKFVGESIEELEQLKNDYIERINLHEILWADFRYQLALKFGNEGKDYKDLKHNKSCECGCQESILRLHWDWLLAREQGGTKNKTKKASTSKKSSAEAVKESSTESLEDQIAALISPDKKHDPKRVAQVLSKVLSDDASSTKKTTKKASTSKKSSADEVKESSTESLEDQIAALISPDKKHDPKRVAQVLSKVLGDDASSTKKTTKKASTTKKSSSDEAKETAAEVVETEVKATKTSAKKASSTKSTSNKKASAAEASESEVKATKSTAKKASTTKAAASKKASSDEAVESEVKATKSTAKKTSTTKAASKKASSDEAVETEAKATKSTAKKASTTKAASKKASAADEGKTKATTKKATATKTTAKKASSKKQDGADA